jgi:hypothetical protein
LTFYLLSIKVPAGKTVSVQPIFIMGIAQAEGKFFCKQERGMTEY